MICEPIIANSWISDETDAGTLKFHKRHWKKLHRASVIVITMMLVLSVFAQQTRADELIYKRIVHGPTPTRDFIPFYPSVVQLALDSTGRALQRVSEFARWKPYVETYGAPAVEPTPGAPREWEASEPVAPFTMVNLANGNLISAVPVFSWDLVSFGLIYNSSLDTPGAPGLPAGWSHSYTARLDIQPAVGTVTFTSDDQTSITFEPEAFADFEDEGGVDDRINRLALLRDVNQVADPDDDHWILTDDSQAGMRFDSTGRLLQIFDAGGSGVNLEYDNGRLTSITDSADRSLDLAYNASGQLSTIEAPPFEYTTQHGTGHQTTLRRVTLSYYNDGRLKHIWSPRRDGDYPWSSGGEEAGEPIYAVELAYYDSGSLKAITDYEGNRSRFFYHPTTGALARVDHPAVYDYVLDEEVVTSRAYAYTFDGTTGAPITEVTNERNGLTTYGFDEQGRLERVTDPLDRVVTQLTWTPQNRVATSTNVLGGVTAMTYNDDGNPIQIESESGTVTMDYDLRKVKKITDAVGQVVNYRYEDAENPTKITQIDGPGEADDANFVYNCSNMPASGKIRQLIGPNRTVQGFQYEGRNVARYLRQNEDSDAWHTENRCCSVGGTGGTGGTGGVGGGNGCGEIESSAVNNPTGEPRVVGGQENCPGQVSLSPVPELEGLGGVAHEGGTCPAEAPLDESCGVCGCERRRNEAGSVVKMQEGNCQGVEETTTEASVDDGYICGSGSGTYGRSNVHYNGNEQPTCVFRAKLSGLQHRMEYDPLSRMTEYEVRAGEHYGDHYRIAQFVEEANPNYWVSYRYSDTTGSSYIRYYRRTKDEVHWATVREFKTECRTDLAGRIVSVTRDDQTTKYYYEDSTVYPAVTEVRPDGSKTGIFLDEDGQVRRIAHTDPHGIVMAAYDYTRDANGRVTRVEEEIKDRRAADGYRSDVIEYVYGDGALKASDLDDDAANVPNADKLYYDFLADLGDGHALKSSDPNRLVVERRTNNDSGDERVAVTFMKEYFYDPGGNRLAMRVSDPATGEVQSITRYNYFTREVHQAEATSDTPGTPRFSATLAMDYEGRGMDKLFSTLTYYPADPDRVDVVQFGYDYDFYEQEDSDITSRIDSTYVYNEGGGWHLAERAATGYTYDNGSLVKVAFEAADFCPSTCASCDESCTDEVSTSWDEYYAHDVFGRRIAISHEEDGEETTSMYDYAGPSNQVLAVRLHRRVVEDHGGLPSDHLEDPFVSTYTHGPLGVITQTEEGRNADPADNRDHYVLEDLMGGHNVLAVDHDGDSATDRLVSYQTFDAFGNVQKKWLPHTATFAWRGSEGSKTDPATNLVEMGARTYDPTLGRFLQSDALPMASATSQGMNRYIYCENDPVNASDPSGQSSAAIGYRNTADMALIWAMLFSFAALGLLLLGGPSALPLALMFIVAAVGALAAYFGAMGDFYADLGKCDLARQQYEHAMRATYAAMIIGGIAAAMTGAGAGAGLYSSKAVMAVVGEALTAIGLGTTNLSGVATDIMACQ